MERVPYALYSYYIDRDEIVAVTPYSSTLHHCEVVFKGNNSVLKIKAKTQADVNKVTEWLARCDDASKEENE